MILFQKGVFLPCRSGRGRAPFGKEREFMAENHPVVGILGGLGPMAGVYFYQMLIEHTAAQRDQDHIDVVLSGRATTPDRTAYILGQSQEDPFTIMEQDAQNLVRYGATMLAIPCNTAHYFYDRLSRSLTIPVLNMVDLTVAQAKAMGCTKLGILATSGTVDSHTYQRMCRAHDMDYGVPCPNSQARLMEIIYRQIKTGQPVDLEQFYAIGQELKDAGCQRAVLGCTELSLIKRDHGLDDFYIDSSEVLAKQTILACGKQPIGFDW